MSGKGKRERVSSRMRRKTLRIGREEIVWHAQCSVHNNDTNTREGRAITWWLPGQRERGARYYHDICPAV